MNSNPPLPQINMAFYRDPTFDDVLLEPEQKITLEEMVEAARRVARNAREKFIATRTMGRPATDLIHDGWPQDHQGVFEGDLDALVDAGLLAATFSRQGTPLYDITPLGYKYYEHLQHEKGAPTTRVESTHRSYIDAAAFKARYPLAYQKWARAEALVWSAESEAALTMIGHLCRESLQEFMDELSSNRGLANPAPKAATISRLRFVIGKTPRLGETARAHLDAMLVYASTLIDLTQRQEHGGLREGEPLTWDDGRRLVFQTLVVLAELDRELGTANA